MATTATSSAAALAAATPAPITLDTLRQLKKARSPIAMLTAYDFPTARLFAGAGIEVLLVGDSVATTVLGEDSTTAATMDLLVLLTRAVRKGAPGAFIMADMPFGSYPDVPTAVATAGRFVRESGADAVKLEADLRHKEMVRAMSAAGIVTCAHVGLLPQRAVHQGGYIAQGRTPGEAARIAREAVELAEAGAHLLLVEAVPDEVTAEIQGRLAAAGGALAETPVLGCGAGPSADGHVIVSYDLLGYNARTPRFVERYGDAAALIADAAHRYREAVKSRAYPAAHHQYRMKTSE
jgi:3-methyl-2-oxobutanoate hydroxymethyltransferase